MQENSNPALAALAALPEAVVMVDATARVAWLNPPAAILLGWPGETLVGQPLTSLTAATPISTPEWTRLTVCQADGQTALMEARWQSFALEGGIWHIMLVRPPQAFTERLQSVALAAAANGVVITDTAGVVQWVNPAFTHITGYMFAEIVGQHTRLLRSGQHPPEFYADLWRTVQAGHVWHGEITNRRKDGSLYTEEQIITPVRDADGRISHYVAIKHDITARKQAEHALRQRTEQLAVLNRVFQNVSALLDVQAVLEKIVVELQQVVPFDSVSVLELRTDHMRIAWAVGLPSREAFLGLELPLAGTPNAEVVRTHQPLILDDAPTHYAAFTDPLHAQANIHSWLGVPMLFEGDLLGMLALDKHEPGFYTLDHAQAALAFAAQAAIAIHNARHYRAEQERRLLAETMRELGNALNANLDQDRVLSVVLEQLAQVLPYTSASLMLLEGDSAQVVAQRGLKDPSHAHIRLRYRDFANLRELVDTGRPVIIHDTHHDPRWTWFDAPVSDIRCWLGVPLLAGGQIIGILNLERARPNSYEPADAELAATFAAQAALALHNARLLRTTRQRLAELATINAISQAITTQLDWNTLLELVGDEMRRVFDVQAVYISLLEGDTNVLHIPYWRFYDERLAGVTAYRDRGLTGIVFRTGQPLIINNNYRQEVARLGGIMVVAQRTGRYPQAWLGVPILSRSEVIGVLSLQNYERENVFTEDDVRVISTVAAHIGIALQNARLYTAAQNELAERQRVEAALRTKLAEIEHLQAQLREQAIRDPLTHLFNRRYLQETLEREMARSRREHSPLAVVMMDIDHFKRLNDTYSHAAGDRMLQALADLLRQYSRGGDVACRYGGEEFLMVLPKAGLEDACRRAEHWRRAFAALRVPYEEHTLQATLSLGVACYPLHADNPTELIHVADVALYAAKSNGRNQVVAGD